MKHTEMPWKIHADYSSMIENKNGRIIADCSPDDTTKMSEDESNTAHIVKCVNAHDGLVESLSEIVEHLESIADAEGFKISDHAVYQRAKEALKAAGVEI